jgi:hypothetical protein
VRGVCVLCGVLLCVVVCGVGVWCVVLWCMYVVWCVWWECGGGGGQGLVWETHFIS